MKKHPNALTLEGYYHAQPAGDREILRHLNECPRCRELLGGVLQKADRPAPTATDPAIPVGPAPEGFGAPALAFAGLLARERVEAPAFLAELLRQPMSRRESALLGGPRFYTWGLVDLLLQRSLETAPGDPDGAEHLGRLALVLAGRLNAEVYGGETVEDLKARAWAHIGNARRVRSDLPGAEQAFARAHGFLERGTGRPLERAALLDLEASYRRDQRQFDQAAAFAEEAARTFRAEGDLHRAGRSLLKLSTVLYCTGDLARSTSLLQEALELLDSERDPRLALSARHNLTLYFTDAGRFPEALAAYREARPLYREVEEPWLQNRRKWVRGRIVKGLGRPHSAEKLFLQARDSFVEEGIPYDTALVSLDLALLYAEQGRTEDLKRLAGEMVPIFSSLQIHREALAALGFLKRAIEAERAGVEVVGAVAEFVRKARWEPGLRFEGV